MRNGLSQKLSDLKISSRDSLQEFLPAALEVQDSPPNPLSQWLTRIILVLFSVFLIWTYFGEINIVATAEGMILPSSRVKQIQVIEKARVKAILVQQGDHVTEGQALVELDGVLNRSGRDSVDGELKKAKLKLVVDRELLRLWEKHEISGESGIIQESMIGPPTIDVDESQSQTYKKMVLRKWQRSSGKLQSLMQSKDRLQSELKRVGQVIKKLELTLPLMEKQAAITGELYQKKYASEVDFLVAEQKRLTIAQDLLAERDRVSSIMAEIESVQSEIDSFLANVSAELLSSVEDLEGAVFGLTEELRRADELDSYSIIYSPVSGLVKEISIHTLGGVVRDAETIMTIVPEKDSLEAEVKLENKDIGFISEGMPAEVKVHAFPYTKYGVIDGKLKNITGDSIEDEKKGFIYRGVVALSQDSIAVNGLDVRLMPGMTLTVEIATGKRRIIEYFLSPIIKHSKESARER